MIIEKEDFLNSQESEELIKIGESLLFKAGVLGKNSPDSYRTAESAWLPEGFELVQKIKDKISDLTNEPKNKMEGVHLVKYNVGGEYKTHHDFFHPGTDYYEGCMIRGGQRKKSALIYLNDDFKGGETDFPSVGRTITPKKNKIVVWDNLKENGELDYDSLHAGLPVIEGIKYIVVVWIRQGNFR